MLDLVPFQVGPVEEKTLELVDLIDSYNLATDFAHWISDGEYTCTVLKEHSEQGKYTRIVQFRLGDCIFFNGTGEFFTDRMDADMILTLTKTSASIHSNSARFAKLKKINISKVISDPYYTVVSRFYANNEIAAASWAVYNLPRLVKIYNKKHDHPI